MQIRSQFNSRSAAFELSTPKRLRRRTGETVIGVFIFILANILF